jgi:hypothetical protein
MNFNIMLNDICEEMSLSAVEVYEFSRWMNAKFNDDDFDDEGNLVSGELYD